MCCTCTFITLILNKHHILPILCTVYEEVLKTPPADFTYVRVGAAGHIPCTVKAAATYGKVKWYHTVCLLSYFCEGGL